MKTKFNPDGFQHTYQRTYDKGVFLYSIAERLMLFTILSVKVRNYKIKVCGLAFMFTHIHSLVKVHQKSEIGSFYSASISTFVLELNKYTGRNGRMFGNVKSASKPYGKKARESICYLYNNSVEKKLFINAEEDRWNFLAYYSSINPFSKKLVKRNCRYALRMALHIVDINFKQGKYLNLATIDRIFKGLDCEESEQLIDYIIVKYNFICYEDTIDEYNNFNEMCSAIHSNAGKEYDLHEEFYSESDCEYRSLIHLAKKEGLLGAEMKLLALNEDEKKRYASIFMRQTSATKRQVFKFLHIPPPTPNTPF